MNVHASPCPQVGRRGLAAAFMSAVVLATLGAVAYAAVYIDKQDVAVMYKASGRIHIRNSKGGDVLVGMQDMLPGDQSSGKVRIGNDSRVKARFSLGLSRLVEIRGAGGGTLSLRLALKVERLSTTRRPCSSTQGPLRRMPAARPGRSQGAASQRIYPLHGHVPARWRHRGQPLPGQHA